jgi:hypothetical protein
MFDLLFEDADDAQSIQNILPPGDQRFADDDPTVDVAEAWTSTKPLSCNA